MNNIKALAAKALMLLALPIGVVGGGLLVTSCSDEPDTDHFYTFTGEMLSDYLANRPQYSDFYYVVSQAKMLDLLSTYGSYTCFLPSNDAMQEFLKERGLKSVEDLSFEDCDTIARTHLVANMYSTFDMTQDVLSTANMLGRYLATEQSVDADSNAVVMLEGNARIIFSKMLDDGQEVHQNDSVENGIVQPIDKVIEKSNSFVADILRNDPSISIFYEALVKTGVREQILPFIDPDYDNKAYPKYYYKSHIWKEVAWVPDTKKYGFTGFIEPDSVLLAKFQEFNIDTSQGNLKALYDLAVKFYNGVYGDGTDEYGVHRNDDIVEDDSKKPGWGFDHLTDSINPLRRFIQYHFMTRYVPGTADLTALIPKVTKEAFGFDSKKVNPCEWYQTLLPHTMLKIEQLTMNKDEQGNDCRGIDADCIQRHFVNRRYAAPEYNYRGALVDNTVDKTHDALNGHYFYVDDLVVFSYDVQNVVQNMRIRMDFSTVWPEVMTNDMRLKGNYLVDDAQDHPDDSNTPVNGRNFYFPLGYLDGVTFNPNCHLVMRRPHCNFWSWQGDEWNLFGDYDMTFRIPPVPYTGEWQLRLGFCAIPTRGVMQVYYDGKPQGIPLDMTKELNSTIYLGDEMCSYDDYLKKTDEEKAEEQKLLKNLGAYRAGRSTYHFGSGGGKGYFLGDNGTYRKILCQTRIDATQDHYIRFRVASDGKQGNDNEFMLDYFEMVPKSVYGVDQEGAMEDDL